MVETLDEESDLQNRIILVSYINLRYIPNWQQIIRELRLGTESINFNNDNKGFKNQSHAARLY